MGLEAGLVREKKRIFGVFLKEKRSKKLSKTGAKIVDLTKLLHEQWCFSLKTGGYNTVTQGEVAYIISFMTKLYHEQWLKMEEMQRKRGVFRDNIVP